MLFLNFAPRDYYWSWNKSLTTVVQKRYIIFAKKDKNGMPKNGQKDNNGPSNYKLQKISVYTKLVV